MDNGDELAGLHTPLCELLSCRQPIVLAPMGGVGTPELVAAVSAAGGFGILPAMGLPPAELARRIAKTRDCTDRPFGVNLVLHPDVRSPAHSSTIARETAAGVRAVLDGFRGELGLAAPESTTVCADDVAAAIEATIDVVLAERPHVLSVGLGAPSPELVAQCRARGIHVIAMVTRVADAIAWEQAGAAAIVAQGAEAGGHRSSWLTHEPAERACVGAMVLTAEVSRAVQVPVIAAGGIADGRGLAAALMLGASGVYMGTRFLASKESGAPEVHARAVVEARSHETTITSAFTGLPARVVQNRYASEYHRTGAPTLPPIHQDLARADIATAALARSARDYLPLYAGQSVGLIDQIQPAGDIVRACVREARSALLAGARLVLREASSSRQAAIG